MIHYFVNVVGFGHTHARTHAPTHPHPHSHIPTHPHLKRELATIAQLRDSENVITVESSISTLEPHEETASDSDIWSYHKNLVHQLGVLASSTASTANDPIELEYNMCLVSPVSALTRDPFEIWEEMKTVYPNLYALNLPTNI